MSKHHIQEPKRIIWAGGDPNYETQMIERFEEKIPSLRFDYNDSVNQILHAINSGKYVGMYVANLVIPQMMENPRLLDLSPHEDLVRHGTGLYVIRKAKQRKLQVIACPENIDEVSDISDLGAIVCQSIAQIEKLLKQFFLEQK